MDSATTGTSDGFSSAWPGPTLQREDGVRGPGTHPELAAAGEAGASVFSTSELERILL